MTDPAAPEYGLGAIQSPPDVRDWPIDLLYATAGVDPVAAPPASYRALTPYPPVYNQGSSPRCVAYSNGASKAYQDLRDTGLFAPDFATFFSQIGGTQDGAVPRVALQQMLDHGYPPSAAGHRIAAYYSVPVDRAAIQSAIMGFGPVLFSSPWYYSWFRPVNGVLPAPDSVAGGHEYEVVGWSATGFRIRNSWGAGWADGGEATIPWAYLSRVREVWKSVDKIDVHPRVYTMHFAARARVMSYLLTPADLLTDSTVERWDHPASTAMCGSPVIRRGTNRGQATVCYVPRGHFQKRYVKVNPADGVSVTWQ
jgi:hypothetical protein